MPERARSRCPSRSRPAYALTAKITSLACDYPSAEAALTEAFADVEVLDDRRLLGEVLTYQGFVRWTHMGVAAGAEATSQGLALLDPAVDVWACSEATWELLGCLLLSGRLRQVAEKGGGELDAAAARSGNPIALYAASLYRALLAGAAGDLHAMDSWAEETVALCKRAGLPWGSAAHGYLGWAALWRGRLDDAARTASPNRPGTRPAAGPGGDPALRLPRDDGSGSA